ncbi:NADPH-dependent diflavin oxidoreductase 1-like [Centruroides vittatus]|uniref:NADPH-dependent diflavin oxidoreductase 1-like n=1 Tax=Centruroides vittatus TaxID=120091 RepID=UPI003510591A
MNARDGRRITILFGSETGNSEDLSERISREAKRRHFRAKLFCMDEYPIVNLIEERLVVFVCSTTGQGEEPENMKQFWKFLLRKNLPSNSLQNMKYSVIGLGDSSYRNFNYVAKKLHKRLMQLGGNPFMPLVLGDDQHEYGYDGMINPWLDKFWSKLLEMYPLPNGTRIVGEDVLWPPRFKVEFVEEDGIGGKNPLDGDHSEHRNVVTLISNRRVTSPDHFQDVRLVRLNVEDSDISYSPGDVAVLEPSNLEKNVDAFLKLLSINPEQKFLVRENDPDISVPDKLRRMLSVRECAEKYWDISSIPRRSFFELFWHFSQSELEKEKLVEFCQPEGQEELYSYCNRPRRTILEVLQDFPHTTPHVPFEYFFDLIPPIKPRLFSIASSPLAHPGEIHLLVAIVKYRTKLHAPREGLCSNWLASLQPDDNIRLSLSIKKGSISLPSGNKPLIMIGPGTGCAPFRSFIHERHCKNIGNNYLFFGCRSKAGDFYFESEWNNLIQKNMLNLYAAFSRDQEEKVYVQHKMLENKELIWNLINDHGAWIYVAGNAKQMPQDVRSALLDIVKDCSKLNADEAENYLKNLEKTKCLQYEVWS